MDLLGDDSDSNNDASESKLTINKRYAQSYEKWRKKEERQKLIDKYGEDAESESSSSSSEEEEIRSTPQLDRDWLRAYAVVRFNQPRLYTGEDLFHETIKPAKKKVTKGETLKDYERRFILEKGGVESDDDADVEEQRPEDGKSYFEEQEEIKDSFKAALQDSDDDKDDEDEEKGPRSLLVKKIKTKEQQAKEENDYLEWLKGEREVLEDEQAVLELAPLKAYWNDPNLGEKEKVLRDYILNNGYMDREESDDESESDEGPDFGEEEKFLDEAEDYEHRYNFRHEEPGGTEIKSYPRQIETSVRMKDSRRGEKRQRRMEKKNQERKEKQDEIRLLQKLQQEEKEEKLHRLREISQNPELNYDLEADFDPEEHKKIMEKYFSGNYYHEEDQGKKPVFEFDEAVDDDSDDWWYKRSQSQMAEESEQVNMENAEEEEFYGEKFVMDADYDSNVDYKSKKRRDKKKKSKKSAKKPAFDPSSKSFDEFVDDYLKDRIPTLPFPYREVVPNDFGLSTTEILTAPDRELNSWVSVKKMSMYRSSFEEEVDLKKFKAKAQNLTSKFKKMPSLFSDPSDDVTIKKKKKKKKKNTQDGSGEEEQREEEGEKESSSHLKSQLKESTNDTSSGAKRKGPSIEGNSTQVKKRRKIDREKDKGIETEVQDGKKKKKKKMSQKSSDSTLTLARSLQSSIIDDSPSLVQTEPETKNGSASTAKNCQKRVEHFLSKDKKGKTEAKMSKKKKKIKEKRQSSQLASSNTDVNTSKSNRKSFTGKNQESGLVQSSGKDSALSSAIQISEVRKKKKLKRSKLHLDQSTITASGQNDKKASKKTRKEELKKLMSSYRLSKYGIGSGTGKELNKAKKKKKKKLVDS